jgi:putative Mn2+ efflux pump MntP
MDILSIVFIAFALSMDAFAVSIASGVIIRNQKVKKAVTFGLMFGGFQMFMPIIGYAAGHTFRSYITTFDHWIAFGLLSMIGAKMIHEAFQMEQQETAASEVTGLTLLGLSIATSIDALAVGVSFSFLNVNIWGPALLIGVITFGMSFAGVLLGNRCGAMFEKKVEIAGGVILIGIGIKILVEHLTA